MKHSPKIIHLEDSLNIEIKLLENSEMKSICAFHPREPC